MLVSLNLLAISELIWQYTFLKDKRTMSNTFFRFLGASNTPTVITL